MNQTTINDAYKKEARERACMLITRWMYEAAIPFNAVTYPSFQPMIEAIGQYGVGMKGPTFHEVRVTNLKKELALTKDLMKDHMVEWGKNGCSIMSDGWTDRKERTLVNFWATQHDERFTGQRELLRPAKTRFATAFITLSRLHEQKNNLRKMFTSSDWSDNFGSPSSCASLVDGEKKAPMGYIYEAMNRAKDAIVRSFNGNEEKYKETSTSLIRGGDSASSAFACSRDYSGNELAVRTRKTKAPVHQVVNGIGASLRIFIARGEIGRMEDEDSHGGAQDDFVFDDDNLTWGDVARAAGAEEARFDTRARARASSSIIPPTRGIASSSRTLPSYSLIDEDEDGDMVDSADEENGEGYKCGDGNDDDDDFVDLEEE
ncbi:hypothetical protein CK203_115599 [Vitis vinifera]|uniref:DUF659 domain-containing protein n=1 Tax=Vitis vinifera TaxID=29760 RepID=A0A438EZT9_VITVI|nr:hypothetical protein CK203_115599 [Vitis vinifera]